MRPGSDAVGGKLLNSMPPAAVLVCRICWTVIGLPVSVTLIASTYALRIGSVEAFHAGLRTNSIDLAGTYDLISYGPSAS